MNETEKQQLLSALTAELAYCITKWADNIASPTVSVDLDTLEVGTPSADFIVVDIDHFYAYLGNFSFDDILRDSSAEEVAARYVELYRRDIIEKIEEKIEENNF